MKHFCKLCAIEISPERKGDFCSNACKHIWQLQYLPKLRRESVMGSGNEVKAAIKLAPGCFMRVNLQNCE